MEIDCARQGSHDYGAGQLHAIGHGAEGYESDEGAWDWCRSSGS